MKKYNFENNTELNETKTISIHEIIASAYIPNENGEVFKKNFKWGLVYETLQSKQI